MRLPLSAHGAADPAAVHVHGPVRVSLLGDRIIRIERSSTGFEDRPTLTVIDRRFPVPSHTVDRQGSVMSVITPAIALEIDVAVPFSASSCHGRLVAGGTWAFGIADAPGANRGGTTDRLDGCQGPVAIPDGLVSASGWALVDDSRSACLGGDGLPCVRSPEATDIYLLLHGLDAQAALRDWWRLSGAPPVPPRWALGIWWSKWWAYDAQAANALVREFSEHGVPLSTLVLDMDWHLVKNPHSNGWTGTTWNTALFPDPAGFIAHLSTCGVAVGLNLHPGDVHTHESGYPAMAEALCVAEGPVRFDPARPGYAAAYLEALHRPLEHDGVKLWWIDHLAMPTGIPGCDSLRWLCLVHSADAVPARGCVLARWPGWGGQRAGIGFSGDAISTWEVLVHQIYATPFAANAGACWWSHDIGGHMKGEADPELLARWIQFGAVSPILRLHAFNSRFDERRPWLLDGACERAGTAALRLRNALIPLLASAAWRTHEDGLPVCAPMEHRDRGGSATAAVEQYRFCGDLVAAPYRRRCESTSRLARSVLWLPEGRWFHVGTGAEVPSGWQARHGDIDDLPLFAPAGALVPLARLGDHPPWAPPRAMDLLVFPWASGSHELNEDPGEGIAPPRAVTSLQMTWAGEEGQLVIASAQGTWLPPVRRWRIRVPGLDPQAEFELDGQPIAAHWDGTWAMVEWEQTATQQRRLRIIARGSGSVAFDRAAWRRRELLRLLISGRSPTKLKDRVWKRADEIAADPVALRPWVDFLAPGLARALCETLFQAGVHRIHGHLPTEERLVCWNETLDPRVTQRITTIDWHRSETSVVPQADTRRFDLSVPAGRLPWSARVDWAGILTAGCGTETPVETAIGF